MADRFLEEDDFSSELFRQLQRRYSKDKKKVPKTDNVSLEYQLDPYPQKGKTKIVKSILSKNDAIVDHLDVMKDMYFSGVSLEKIGFSFGLKKEDILDYFREYRILGPKSLEQHEDRVKKLIDDETPYKEIADHFGVSIHQLKSFIAKRKLLRPRVGILEANKEQVFHLVDNYVDLHEIAFKYGVTVGHLHVFLRKYKVKIPHILHDNLDLILGMVEEYYYPTDIALVFDVSRNKMKYFLQEHPIDFKNKLLDKHKSTVEKMFASGYLVEGMADHFSLREDMVYRWLIYNGILKEDYVFLLSHEADLKVMLENRVSLARIADHFGVSIHYLKDFIAKRNLLRFKVGILESNKDHIFRLIKNNVSLREVALKYGVRADYLGTFLKKHKVKIPHILHDSLDLILEMVEEYYYPADITYALHATKGQMKYFLKEHPIDFKNKLLDKNQAMVNKLRVEGYSIEEIATYFGLREDMVTRWLSSHNRFK